MKPVANHLLAACALAGLAAAMPAPSRAAIITLHLEFTAAGFLDLPSNPTAPTDPVIGAFSLTFDNSASIGPTSAGLTLDYLNIALGYTFEFLYSQSLDRVLLGGRQSPVSALCNVASNTDNFCLFVTNVSTAAIAAPTFTYSAEQPSSHVWTTHGIRLRELAVPEPATLGLLAAGLAGLGLVRRRKT